MKSFVSTSKLILLNNNSQVTSLGGGGLEMITCLLISNPEMEALTLEMGCVIETETQKVKAEEVAPKKNIFLFPW